MKINFSFIIPTYNSEKTIIRALDSIVNQLNKNDYEIIVIDDSSKDNTSKLIDKYMNDNNDINIILIKTEGGVSHARNKGIELSRGKYILFLDSDDYYVTNSLILMKTEMVKNDNDLLIFDFEHGNKMIRLKEVSRDNIKALAMMLKNPTQYMTVWGKVYKRNIIETNNIMFNESLKLSEDSEFLVRYLQYSKDVSSSRNILYHYSIDNISVMRGKNYTSKISGYLEALKRVREDIGNDPELMTAFYHYATMQLNIMMVRDVFNYSNAQSNQEKIEESNRLLENTILKEAINNIQIKDCLSLRYIPIVFIKLDCALL